jgi:cytochrome P450
LKSVPLDTRGDDVLLQLDRPRPAVATGGSRRRTLDDLPGPAGLPLLGNALQIRPERLPAILEGWEARFGRVYRLRLGSREIVVVSGSQMVQAALLARPDVYRRASELEPVFEEVGIPGVFSVEGASWRVQRRLAMEALSNRTLRSFYPDVLSTAARLRERWSRAADAGAVVDILADCRKFTVDATTQLAFGQDARTLEGDEDDIQRKLQAIFPPLNRRATAFFPHWRYVKLPSDRKFERTVVDVRGWLEALVTRARAAQAGASHTTSSNFLQAMVAARDETGKPFSDAAVFGNLVQMLLAGEDTTANSIAFAIHELCDAPSAVDELRAEITRACDTKMLPSTLDAAATMTFASAVANETMRLHPVVPVSPLEANVDTVLGDLAIAKGTRIWLLSRPAGLDPTVYDDPHAFRPQRWLDKGHESAAIAQHFPFGAGPRACPGRSLALLLTRVALATLYAAFDVERVGRRDEVIEGFAFLMFPSGLRVRLRRRIPAHESCASTST